MNYVLPKNWTYYERDSSGRLQKLTGAAFSTVDATQWAVGEDITLEAKDEEIFAQLVLSNVLDGQISMTPRPRAHTTLRYRYYKPWATRDECFYPDKIVVCPSDLNVALIIATNGYIRANDDLTAPGVSLEELFAASQYLLAQCRSRYVTNRSSITRWRRAAQLYLDPS